ncbi:MAG: type 4a pilus biogenesis protein PilO [Candidatus Latescibacteria bacterium]|nr:type 4a pilus biogenesis protein PilO [Candidatus Latescibacterota bacterium]
MEILKRKVLLGGLIGIVIIAIIFIIFLYRPILLKNKETDKEINTLRKKIKENEEMAKDISRLREQVIALENQQRDFMSKVIPRNEMLAVVRQLVNLSEGYNLAFTEIKPPGLDTVIQVDNPDSPLKPVPFLLTIQGRYLDIARYLESLLEFPYFLRTPEVEIISRDDIRPLVEVRVLINIYVSSLVVKTSS